MRAKTNTITINGRTYNIATGQSVDGHHSGRHSEVIKPTVVAPTRKHATPLKSATPKPTSKKIRITDQSEKSTSGGQHIVVRVGGRQPERSKTLMRRAVKKPDQKHSAHAVASLVKQPEHLVFHKGVARERQARATTHTKSELVHKFAPRNTISRVTAHVPVAPAPEHVSQKAAYDISNTPPTPLVEDSRPLREVHRDLFDQAIQTATSHTAKKHASPKKHRRAARFALGAASLVVLAVFFAYQNAPNFALKRASSTIGFTASMPGYRPSGFRTGPVQYEPGKVTIDFRSNSDSRAYTITQSTAYFNTQALQNNYLKGKSYETVQNGGQVSFLYGNANLTWVRNGIWYNIQGDSQLSRDQLLRVANSLF